jgi:ABC-2 type transport system permease protein
MKKFLNRLLGHRLLALLRKEFAQIRRDRRLAISLIMPPIVQLLLFSLVLDATVSNLKLGVIDESRTPESRDLIATLTESKSFRLSGYYYSPNQLGDAISRGSLDAGVVIPRDFTKDLKRGRPVTVQFILNAMNANTAAIAQGYAEGVLTTWNQGQVRVSPVALQKGSVLLTSAYLYNPGLINTWFVVTGIFGLLLILNGSLVAATSMVKEREAGTIEQLLMSPAGTYEIIIAKIVPLFLLLFIMVLVAMAMIKLVLNVPFNGSIISFFVNPLLTTVSGAITPSEAIPAWLRPLASINPIHHFSVIARSSMIKGTGIETLWPNFLVLAAFTVIMVVASVLRFRKQLS